MNTVIQTEPEILPPVAPKAIPDMPKKVAMGLKRVAMSLLKEPVLYGEDVLEVVGRRCIEAGLLIHCSQIGRTAHYPPKGQEGAILVTYEYEAMIAANNGEVWQQPIRSSITVEFKGAMSSGFSQMIFTRDLLRNIFMIPLPEQHLQEADASGSFLDEGGSREHYGRLKEQIRNLKSQADLDTWMAKSSQMISRLRPDENRNIAQSITGVRAILKTSDSIIGVSKAKQNGAAQ